jgi:transposase InsO family protein
MNSIMRKKAKHKDHIWSWDFIHDSDDHNRALKWLVIVDEFTHECLALEVARSIKAEDLIDVLADLFLQRGLPKYIRSDNGPEFVSKKIQKYLQIAKIKTLYVKKGSPWENGYVESFNNILRDELLNAEIFLDVPDAKAHARRWRNKYNHQHPHSSLGYVPPANFSQSCLEVTSLGLASLALAPCPLNTT